MTGPSGSRVPGKTPAVSDQLSHELIPLSAPEEWDRALRGLPHSHAHTWGHVRAFQATTSHSTHLYVGRSPSGEAQVACPIAERRWGDSVDAYTPYGFGGFCTAAPVPDLAQAWLLLGRSRGWTTSYIAQNPLFDHGLGFPESSVFAAHTLYYLDLRPSIPELLGSMSRGRARQLRRWDDAPGQLSRDRPEVLTFMKAQATDFFARRQASSAVSFSARTWDLLLDAPSVTVVAVIEGGGVVGAGVFGHSGIHGDALFAITQPGRQELMAPLVWEGSKSLKALGVTSLNLGGALVDGDGIAQFKRVFGCSTLRSSSLHIVHDEQRFASLCRSRGIDPHQRSGYFPAYYRGSDE